jgi:hypothetical protein
VKKDMLKLFSKVKLIFALLSGLILIAIVSYIGFLIWLILQDDRALESGRYVNMASLLVAFISLPGLLNQLLSFNRSEKKKQYMASTKCPNCKHSVEIALKEK